VLGAAFPALNGIIEDLRVTCSTHYLFTNDTTLSTNEDLFKYSSEDGISGYTDSVMKIVSAIVFTSCFTYQTSYRSVLMAFYLCVYSKIRMATKLKKLSENQPNQIGPDEIKRIRYMLFRLSHGTGRKPNRLSIPDDSTVKRSLLERYIMPIAAIAAVASRDDLERAIER